MTFDWSKKYLPPYGIPRKKSVLIFQAYVSLLKKKTNNGAMKSLTTVSYGQTDRPDTWIDGRIDRRTDRRTEGHTNKNIVKKIVKQYTSSPSERGTVTR